VGHHGHPGNENVVANIDVPNQADATSEHAMLADLVLPEIPTHAAMAV
jgi:hypothetical protein